MSHILVHLTLDRGTGHEQFVNKKSFCFDLVSNFSTYAEFCCAYETQRNLCSNAQEEETMHISNRSTSTIVSEGPQSFDARGLTY